MTGNSERDCRPKNLDLWKWAFTFNVRQDYLKNWRRESLRVCIECTAFIIVILNFQLCNRVFINFYCSCTYIFSSCKICVKPSCIFSILLSDKHDSVYLYLNIFIWIHIQVYYNTINPSVVYPKKFSPDYDITGTNNTEIFRNIY